MLWSEFGPWVLPFVPGCSEPLMALHARMAAIKFCTETKCWVRRLEPLMTTGLNPLEIEADDQQTRILDFDMVQVDGIIWPIVDADVGLLIAQDDDQKSHCFSEDMSGIHIYPLKLAGVPVVVRAVMVPKMAATSLDDALQSHVEAISFGAIASLMRVPNQPFSQPGDTFEALFRDRIKAESSRLARGRMAVTPRATPSFI